jgi:hypothetical protein
MNWNNSSYTKKGFILGLIITFIFILIPSYFAPIANYNTKKGAYENYTFVTKTCGNNPSDDCLANVCISRGFSPDSCKNEYPARWRDNSYNKLYANGEKPNIFYLLIPNIKDGLEFCLMFGIFGIILLALPMITGSVIGKIIQNRKSKL